MMPSLLETRSQPDVFFSNSSLYKTSPDLAVGRVGVFADEQEERKILKSKKKKVRKRIDFMARFYQSYTALSGLLTTETRSHREINTPRLSVFVVKTLMNCIND